jgi:hypothetical protein
MVIDRARRGSAHAPDLPVNRRSSRPMVIAGSLWGLTLAAAGLLLASRQLDASQKQVFTHVLLVLCPIPGVFYCLPSARLTVGRPELAVAVVHSMAPRGDGAARVERSMDSVPSRLGG